MRSIKNWIESIQVFESEGIELATELGIQVDEAELIRTNSTGLTIYNPSNLASMIKGMKNKHQSREAENIGKKTIRRKFKLVVDYVWE